MSRVPASGYRVFVSYSHSDRQLLDRVLPALERAGLNPRSDKRLTAGRGFTEQIQTEIAHSHVFIPLLTPQSHRSGWVHQEIGFAAALKVPWVPICVGKIPHGMIAPAHAITVDQHLTDLEAELERVNFHQFIEESGRQWVPPIACAMEPEERAEMIERLANAAWSRFGGQCIRIYGGLTSFSLPDEPPEHPAWPARYGDRPRTHHAYRMFRRERQALEQHARAAGVKLVINWGLDVDEGYGVGAKRSRLSVLIHFLASLQLPDELVQVALIEEEPAELMLLAGDWFFAQSIAGRPVRGVIHTVFTAHAAAVSRAVEDFDHKLDSILAPYRHCAGGSRQRTLEQLRLMVAKLPPHPCWAGYDDATVCPTDARL